MALLLCGLYALLYLVVIGVVLLLFWWVLRWFLATFAPSLVIDPRIWQGLGIIVVLIVAILVLQTLISGGGICAVGRTWWRVA